MTARILTIKHTTSRGRETYGYNICTLIDSETGKRFRCNGGGYDMVGTVLGEWLTTEHQTELLTLADRAYYISDDVRGYRANDAPGTLYGMHFDGQTVRLDGACGVDSMRRIAKAAGVKLTALPSNRNGAAGWIVGDV